MDDIDIMLKNDRDVFLKNNQFFNALLEMLDCCAVLTDENGNIDYIHGDVAPYAIYPNSNTNLKEKLSITDLVCRELHYPLQSLLRKSAENKQKTCSKNIIFDKGRQVVCIKVRQLSLGEQEHDFLITFTPAESLRIISQAESAGTRNNQRHVKELEWDSKLTDDYLQNTIEELKASTKELQSANEELQATNEELRSQTDEAAELIDSLSESEERYRELVTNMNKALMLCEIEYSLEKRPTDLIIHQANTVLKELFALENNDLPIRTGSIPILELVSKKVLARFETIVSSGKPQRFELRLSKLKKDLTLSVYPVGNNRVGVICRDDTKRKAAETILRDNETRYKTIGEAIPYGAWITDAAGNFIYCSPSFLEMAGMTMDQVQQCGWQHLLPEEDIKPTMEHWAKCVESGEDFDREHRLTAGDGSTRYVLALGRSIRNEKGEITSWAGLNIDITDRKETEIALQKSQETLQSALASMTDAVFICDSEGKLIDFNEAFVTFNRFSNREACVKSLDDYFDILDVYKENGEKATLEEWPVSLALHGIDKTSAEYTLQRRDTGETWVGSYSFAPILDSNGIITGSVVTARDITHIKMAEEALTRSEKKYRELIETANSIIICWGRTGIIRFVNSFGLRFFGYSAKELFGKNVTTILPKIEKGSGRDLEALAKEIARHPEKYTYVPNENITKNGDLVWVAWTNKAIRNDQGELEEILAVGNDITALKQAEKELQEGKEHLDRSLVEKEVLLKEIHHRVKNNMQVISSLISLQSNYKNDTNIADIFKDLTHRVRSMAIVHEKLYQSNDLANIDFADYLQSLLTYLWTANSTTTGAIKLQTNLLPIYLPVNIAVPCGLIVNELVNNTLKHAFTKRHSGCVTITLDEVEKNRIKLVVSDDGTGLPPAINWRKTTSMGLQLIHMLTDQIKADVQMTTNNGTTFVIIFDKTQL